MRPNWFIEGRCVYAKIDMLAFLSQLLIVAQIFMQRITCSCDSEIYCQGPILEMVQKSGLFLDSKQFVDMPTSKSKATVLRNFAALPENATAVDVQRFLYENFHHVGYELRIVQPKDWHGSPAFLEKIKVPHKLSDPKKSYSSKYLFSKYFSLNFLYNIYILI